MLTEGIASIINGIRYTAVSSCVLFRMEPKFPPVYIHQQQCPTCSRAERVLETMVNAQCVRDKGGFTQYWLVPFHWVG